MKAQKLFTVVLIMVALLFSTNLFSQITYTAEAKNLTLVPADPTYGNCVYFDVYLTENAGSSGPLYLANADFWFTFNVANFTTPTFEYIPTTCLLKNSLGGSLTSFYDLNMATTFIAPNKLVINVPGPTPTTQAQFNAGVAKIDATPNTHRLGQFVVHTCNMTGTMGLLWNASNAITAFTIAVPPFTTGDVTSGGTFIVPPDLPMPIELTSFTGNVANKRDITLNWNTATETNNQGFDIERKLSTTETWAKVGYIDGKGTTTAPTSYKFEDRKLNTGKYNYRLKQMDFNGNFEYYDLNGLIEVGVPTKYDISQNYPNPFNPTTKVDFDIPFASKVTMKLYDLSGREVMTMVNDQRAPGYYTEIFNMSNLSSGAYFYRIIANGNGQNFTMSKKLMLIK
jgi:hypothetical protein